MARGGGALVLSSRALAWAVFSGDELLAYGMLAAALQLRDAGRDGRGGAVVAAREARPAGAAVDGELQSGSTPACSSPPSPPCSHPTRQARSTTERRGRHGRPRPGRRTP